MENSHEDNLPQCSVIVHEGTTEHEQIRKLACPLCASMLQLYQIHLNEKFFMCGNVECPYPIGIANYHIYKTEENEEYLKGDARGNIDCSSITTGSSMSCAEWADLDKSLRQGSPVSTNSIIEEPQHVEKLAKIKRVTKSEDLLKKNLKKISELNKELVTATDEPDSIDSAKWIKHYAQMQQMSGVQLLTEQELKKVRKVPSCSAAQLKIDIDSSGETISLKIERRCN